MLVCQSMRCCCWREARVPMKRLGTFAFLTHRHSMHAAAQPRGASARWRSMHRATWPLGRMHDARMLRTCATHACCSCTVLAGRRTG
jgi:hypothetical protein